MLLATFEGVHYLLVAIGDGQLVYYVYNKEQKFLTDRKRVSFYLPSQLHYSPSSIVHNLS